MARKNGHVGLCKSVVKPKMAFFMGMPKKSKDPRTLLLMLLFARVRTATIGAKFHPFAGTNAEGLDSLLQSE